MHCSSLLQTANTSLADACACALLLQHSNASLLSSKKHSVHALLRSFYAGWSTFCCTVLCV